jgi:hypothetical protein
VLNRNDKNVTNKKKFIRVIGNRNVKNVINDLNIDVNTTPKSRAPGRKALVSIIKGYPSLPFMGIIVVCSETCKIRQHTLWAKYGVTAFDT